METPKVIVKSGNFPEGVRSVECELLYFIEQEQNAVNMMVIWSPQLKVHPLEATGERRDGQRFSEKDAREGVVFRCSAFDCCDEADEEHDHDGCISIDEMFQAIVDDIPSGYDVEGKGIKGRMQRLLEDMGNTEFRQMGEREFSQQLREDGFTVIGPDCE